MNFIRTLWKHRNAYLFISPFFVAFAAFQLFPIAWSFRISLTRWNGFGTARPVGFENYAMLMGDYMFWDAVKNTVVYWLTAVVLILPLSLLVASLLNYKKLRARRFFTSVSYLPNVCAAVAIGLIFNIIFDTRAGIINETLGWFGVASVEWLTSVSLSKIPVIVLNVWRHTPWFTLIVLSGLLSIPEEYYEAAKIDGANVWQQFFRITLPSLGNILFFNFLILTVDSWNIFTEPYILKGPGTSNLSVFQYMYESSFQLFKFGYAAAIGYILTMVLLVLSIIQFVARKREIDG